MSDPRRDGGDDIPRDPGHRHADQPVEIGIMTGNETTDPDAQRPVAGGGTFVTSPPGRVDPIAASPPPTGRGSRIAIADGVLIGPDGTVEGAERIRVRMGLTDASGGPDLVPESWLVSGSAAIRTGTVRPNRSGADAAAVAGNPTR